MVSISSEVVLKDTVQDFGLAVGLRVEGCTKPPFNQGISTDLSLELRSDSSILVRDYSFRGSVLKLDIFIE